MKSRINPGSGTAAVPGGRGLIFDLARPAAE
jgi:hypothetical protein